MASGGEREDKMVDRLVLDMKAVGLLHASDEELNSLLMGKVAGSPDEQVRRVAKAIEGKRSKGGRGSVVIALGELLLASFLMVFGLLMIVPLIGGAVTPSSLVTYFGSALRTVATASPVFPLLPEIVVALAVIMLMSALYSLRRASATLKEESSLSR